jgi:hypothetical protein
MTGAWDVAMAERHIGTEGLTTYELAPRSSSDCFHVALGKHKVINVIKEN